MAPQKFVVVFDSPTGAYYAGTQVTGRILLTVDKPKKARGVKIKCLGEAKVSWTELKERRHEGESRTETILYYADEEYFSYSYYLIGSANGEIEIPAGEHVYPFTYTLPPRLPSSFNGEHGYVRYTVKATVDRAWSSDYTAEGIFNVVTPVDLNYIAAAKEPVKEETSKTFCCWCCKSGPLTLAVHVPYTGVVPGQTFPITIEVDNASDVDVESIDCKVKKEIEWVVRMPSYDTKKDSDELAKISCPGVEASKSLSLTQNVTIPQMPHVDMEACSIINVKFLLKLVAVVSGMHKNLSLEIPLMLGTIPIYGAPMEAPPAPADKEDQALLQPAVIMGQPLPGLAGQQFDSPNVVQPTPVMRTPLPGLAQPTPVVGQPLPGLAGGLPPYPTIPPPTIGFNVTPPSPVPSAPAE